MDTMKISLVLPTHRSTNTAIARIIEWSSLSGDDFELIVRDNSENEKKREILNLIESKSLKLHFVQKCNPFDNWLEAMKLATGEFIFSLADDDFLSIRGIEQIYNLAKESIADTSISCITGDYILEASNTSGWLRYPKLDSDTAEQRIISYLEANATNCFYYSAVRRDIALLGANFITKLPYRLSYHDQLISALYLSLGKAKQINRIIYSYNLEQWETAETSRARDQSFYISAGLPIEFDRLHFLFIALEGALLLDSKMVIDRTTEDTSSASSTWFNTMFSKFIHIDRESDYGNTIANSSTSLLREKLLGTRTFNTNEILIDLCETIEKIDQKGAQRYFEFWSAL